MKNLTFRAHHGVNEDERINGNSFHIDVFVKTEVGAAASSDDISDAVDYEILANDVKEEMTKASYLLENVAFRILRNILTRHPMVTVARIKISKSNPPINLPCKASVVKMKLRRSEFDLHQ